MSAISGANDGLPPGYAQQVEVLKNAPGQTEQSRRQLDDWLEQMRQATGEGDGATEDEGYASGDEETPAAQSDGLQLSPASSPASVSSPTSAPKSEAKAAATGSGDPAQVIAENFRSKFGLNDAQIAGILGNLGVESGLKPNVNQGGATGAPSANNADDNQNGWGLAQWGGARKSAQIEYAKQNGLDPGSMEANLGFMNQELQGDYSNTITKLKQATTPQEAALVWQQEYEKATDPHMEVRNQKADEYMRQLS